MTLLIKRGLRGTGHEERCSYHWQDVSGKEPELAGAHITRTNYEPSYHFLSTGVCRCRWGSPKGLHYLENDRLPDRHTRR